MKTVYPVVIVLFLAMLGSSAFAKTHKDNFPVSCDALWPAVKDAVRNAGKYGIIGIDNTEMSVSYNVGGTLTGKRINSAVLNRLGDNACEMQTQTAFSGLVNNDAADFKKRVEDALTRQPQTTEKAAKEIPPQPGEGGSGGNRLQPVAASAPAPAPVTVPTAASQDAISPSPAPGAIPVQTEPATVNLKSTPDGADITIDGKFVGSTPSTIRCLLETMRS